MCVCVCVCVCVCCAVAGRGRALFVCVWGGGMDTKIHASFHAKESRICCQGNTIRSRLLASVETCRLSAAGLVPAPADMEQNGFHFPAFLGVLLDHVAQWQPPPRVVCMYTRPNLCCAV